jgi:hypothetical protein
MAAVTLPEVTGWAVLLPLAVEIAVLLPAVAVSLVDALLLVEPVPEALALALAVLVVAGPTPSESDEQWVRLRARRLQSEVLIREWRKSGIIELVRRLLNCRV